MKSLEFCILSLCLGLVAAHAQSHAVPLNYTNWAVTDPLFTAGPPGSFDEVAVKDPTVVFHNGRWHVFYTSKPRRDSQTHRTALGYVSAPTLEGLRGAPHIEMKSILGEAMIAPQVFYFAPHKLWYLIGHRDTEQGRLHKLEPIYSINPDIENIRGWSKPKVLRTNKQAKGDFWIDFWVICDERKAHLFYADHTDALFRMETPIEKFPEGFADAKELLAIKAAGTNATGVWTFHEASHIYRVKKTGQYLALLEGTYAHPTRKNYWDSRNRFLFGMVADRLEGPWRRIEASDGEFLGEPRWMFNADGSRTKLGQVSHPELLRAGNDQRMEIEDFRLQLFFQAFDASGTPDNYDYHKLPWSLYLMRNY